MTADINSLPLPIREKAIELSKDIEFRTLNNKGGNSYVLIGYNKILKRDVVVKFYYWGGGDHAEPAFLAELDCDHILKVHHAGSINEDDAFFMTPLCASGDLDDALARKHFGTIEAIDVLSQIAAGASFLHGSGYLHRDLKPANVFCLSANKYVIGDFGSVVRQNQAGHAASKTRHSLLYRTPEELLKQCYYKQGDVYQLGLVFFQLLGGRLSYRERDWLAPKQQAHYDTLSVLDAQFYATPLIEARIVKGQMLDFQSLPPWVSKAVRSVIRTCSAVDFNKRYATVSDLSAVLNNIRSKTPDWRIDEHPVLHKKRKKFRITKLATGSFHLEKDTGGGWRRERAYEPASLADAVQIAEGL